MNKKMNKSASKYIRQEKARIRREVSDLAKRDEMIKQLYVKFDPVVPKETTQEEKPKEQVSKPSSKKEKSKKEKPKKENLKQ